MTVNLLQQFVATKRLVATTLFGLFSIVVSTYGFAHTGDPEDGSQHHGMGGAMGRAMANRLVVSDTGVSVVVRPNYPIQMDPADFDDMWHQVSFDLMAIDNSGALLWRHTLSVGFPIYDLEILKARGLVVVAIANYMMGEAFPQGFESEPPLLAALNLATGSLTWLVQFDGMDGLASDIVLGADGSSQIVAFAADIEHHPNGHHGDDDDDWDMHMTTETLYSISSTGQILWSKTLE